MFAGVVVDFRRKASICGQNRRGYGQTFDSLNKEGEGFHIKADTEWLYKGKSNHRVELGRNILVASDQWGFIVDHQVIERQAEVSLTIPLAERLLSRSACALHADRFGEDAIESISFDKIVVRCKI